MFLSKVTENVVAFGLPMGGSVVGAAVALNASAAPLLGSIIGAVAGLLSVALRGWFQVQARKHDAYVKGLERQAARFKRKLKAFGYEPDTEDMEEGKGTP